MAQFSPSTRFAVTLTSACTIAGALIYSGWTAHEVLQTLRNVEREVSSLREEIRVNTWSVRDMRDYVSEVERLNRHLQRTDGQAGATLPDPVDIHKKNLAALLAKPVSP